MKNNPNEQLKKEEAEQVEYNLKKQKEMDLLTSKIEQEYSNRMRSDLPNKGEKVAQEIKAKSTEKEESGWTVEDERVLKKSQETIQAEKEKIQKIEKRLEEIDARLLELDNLEKLNKELILSKKKENQNYIKSINKHPQAKQGEKFDTEAKKTVVENEPIAQEPKTEKTENKTVKKTRSKKTTEKSIVRTDTENKKAPEKDKKEEVKDLKLEGELVENVEVRGGKEKNPSLLEAEKNLEATREKFISEYKKCKKEADKQLLIEKTRTATFNILAGVKNIFSKNKVEKIKKEIRPEDYFTKETKEAKTEYDKARKEMGEQLFEQRKTELEKAGLSGEELKTALTQYKATEVLVKTFEEEKQKIINMKAEGKPALWKRSIDWYMGIKPKWKRVALSTLIFLPLSASGALGASAIAAGGIYAGVAGLVAGKFALSMAIGTGIGYLSKGIDLANKKSDQKFNETQDSKKIELSGKFSNGTIGLEEYEAGIQVIEKEDKDRARNRMLIKFGVGGALAMIGGYVAYDAIGHGMTHLDGSHFDTTHNLTPPKAPEGHLAPGHGVLKIPEEVKIMPHANVEAVADHGQGGISIAREIKANLKTEWGNDMSNAPVSVKHILNTSDEGLAKEWGMYKPGEPLESARLNEGDGIRVDGNGNVTFHKIGVPKDITLEKGVEIKASDTYHGKMFDSDYSGVKVEDTAHIQGQGQGPQEEIINTPHIQSQFEIDHPQVNPVTGEPIINTPHYEAPPQVDPITGQPITQEGSNLDNSNLNARQEEVLNASHAGASLSIEELHQVEATVNENINHLFGTDKLMSDWDYIKDHISAERLMEINKEGGIAENYEPLVHHLHNLEKITGFHPKGASLINPEPETITNFLNRATEEAMKIGRIDEVTL